MVGGGGGLAKGGLGRLPGREVHDHKDIWRTKPRGGLGRGCFYGWDCVCEVGVMWLAGAGRCDGRGGHAKDKQQTHSTPGEKLAA